MSNNALNNMSNNAAHNFNCNDRSQFAVKQQTYHVITDNDSDSNSELYKDNDEYTETYSAVITV